MYLWQFSFVRVLLLPIIRVQIHNIISVQKRLVTEKYVHYDPRMKHNYSYEYNLLFIKEALSTPIYSACSVCPNSTRAHVYG